MYAPIAPDTRAALLRDLARTGDLLRQLDVTITRTDAIGPRGDGVTGGGHNQPLPINDRASEARRQLVRALRRAAVAPPPWRPMTHSPQAAAMSVIQRMPLSGPVAPWVHDQVSALADAYTAAWGAIDRPAQRRIVGHCVGCDAVLYAPAHLDVIQCGQCGREHPATTVRALMNEAAGDYYGSAAELAGLLPHYHGEKVSADRIRQWAHRGDLTGRTGGDGRTLYRVGDVLALHRAAQARRIPLPAR